MRLARAGGALSAKAAASLGPRPEGHNDGMHTSPAPVLDPHADIVELTAAIVDIESVSGNEKPSPTPSTPRCASMPSTSR